MGAIELGRMASKDVEVEVGDHVHGTINGRLTCGTVTVLVGGTRDRVILDGGRSILRDNITMVDKSRPESVEETHEDWIGEIVQRHLGDYSTPRNDALVRELATEVASRLAEAYEEGWRDAEVDRQIKNEG